MRTHFRISLESCGKDGGLEAGDMIHGAQREHGECVC